MRRLTAPCAKSMPSAAAARRRREPPATFREVAAAYLLWLEDGGAKPSTLRDHRLLLAEPGARHRSDSTGRSFDALACD